MKQFRLKAQAQIVHLGTRKEGPDDDKVLAVYVKLTALLDFDVLHFFEPALVEFLYMDKGAVRNTMLGPITFTHELEAYRLEIAGSTHFGAKVKKFAIEAKDSYKVALTFQVSFKPSGDEVAQIAEYLQDVLDVALEPENEELDLSGAEIGAHIREALEGIGPDPLYSEALRHVADSGRPSVSAVQKLLRIGYNRAARLVEQMEHDGYVTPMNSSGSREVTPAGLALAS